MIFRRNANRNLTSWVGALFVGLASLSICLAFGQGQLPLSVAASVLIGILWVVVLLRGWYRAIPWLFLLFIGLSMAGALLDLSRGWLFLGMVSILGAYDLSRFAYRLATPPLIAGSSIMEQHYLKRLLLVVGISGILGLTAYSLTIRIGFGLAVALSLVAVLCFRQTARYLRGEKQD